MSDFTVTKTRLLAGIWEGVVTGPASDGLPPIEVIQAGTPVRSMSLVPETGTSGQWHLRIAVPPDRISDGVQTFLIRDAETEEVLDRFAIMAGEPLAEDLRAEVDLLRAELDMLKKAFRRQALDR